jgi:ABC-type glutathione transport system ATPase component
LTPGVCGLMLPEMDARVELEQLRKTFVQTKRRGLRRERTEVVAVNGVSLSIPAGQSVAFYLVGVT